MYDYIWSPVDTILLRNSHGDLIQQPELYDHRICSSVDKLVSSLATSIVGFPLAVIGYTSALPQPGDSMSSGIFAVAMITFIGIPYIGWIINLIALHFYELDGEKMKEIQLKLSEMKEK